MPMCTKYTKAANAELSKDYDKAFSLYIQAAEKYLQLSRQAVNDRTRALHKGEAAKALERAEKIKALRHDVKPVVKDEFSEGEQLYVLQKSSLVNQGFFPLWSSADDRPSSPTLPALSTEQITRGATWRSHPLAQRELKPEDIVQHIVSDCSVCGAMAVAIDHHRRFLSKIIVSSLFPQDERGFPTRSESGQYQLRVLYNGAHRRDLPGIDDQLPTYPDGTLMCVSTGGKGELWPSLVEKAYMKLAGGYDFIGSDSSTDLHALAGWIPDIIDMKRHEMTLRLRLACPDVQVRDDFQREKTWRRLIKGYANGDCVVTLGTGERVKEMNFSVTLLPTHCYAVIGVHDSEQDRELTIFDPWVQSTEDPAAAEIPSSKQKRSIDISMDTVHRLFNGIYFSWNPAIFEHKLTFHGQRFVYFTSLALLEFLADFASATHSRVQLQLDVSSTLKEDEEVWILLTRHTRRHRAQEEFIALTAHGGTGTGASNGSNVLSTKVRLAGRLNVSQFTVHQVKARVSEEENIWALVASYEGDREDVGFTLTVYSHRNASWATTPNKLIYSQDVEAAFTQKTAGGNHTHSSYYLNPQYHLRVHPRVDGASRASRDAKSAISVSVSTDRQIPVNIMLAWSQGARISELGHNDLALSSGPYTYGYANASGRIPPGDYTLVVSAFEPHHIGKFDLRVECSDRFDLTPIPQEGAGMFSKVVRGEWTVETAGGGPSSGSYSSNPTYELQVSAPAQLRFRLQLTEPSPPVALNVTVFNLPTGTGALGRHVATSGPYSDAISGVIIEKLTLQAGKYLVVPSTYKAGVQAAFRLIMYSTVSGVQLVPRKE
ncbi:hypothetical protein BD309DRAFT_991045 [Dichomitus squalens]|nr:hypothetical protein BD309DRAFT_991045 [Dichomitus squalens]